MDFTKVVRKAFIVDAVEITADNIAEIAPLVGLLATEEDGTPYILVDRRLVPNVHKVSPGFWMTKMGRQVRCYNKRLFDQQFTPNTPEIEGWIDYIDGIAAPEVGAYGQVIEPEPGGSEVVPVASVSPAEEVPSG